MKLLTEETTKEELTEEYKTYPAIKGTLEEKPFYENRYAPIFYEIPMNSKVLDVGCNDGVFMEMLKDKRKCDVTGIDISEVALKEAKERNLNVLIADVEKLPFEDETFDVVTCMEVLSHLFDPKQALKEMARVLKKNGVLLGSCPHKNLESMAWEDQRMHRRYYDEKELKETLETSFRDNHLRVLNGAQFSINIAESLLGNQSAEMLFKSGKKSCLGWDSALQDRSVLRCWFGATQTPGTVYYRMTGFADKMQEMGAEVHYNPYNEHDFNSPAEWTQKIRYIPSENRFTNAHYVHELENLLKVADLSVFQITAYRDILLLLTTARKGVIKKPMWIEIDDWLFDIPPYNSGSFPYHPNSEPEAVAYDQIKLSDGIICSTYYLKDKLNQLFPDKPAYVVKNSLDFKIWDNLKNERPLHKENPDLIKIVYSGCTNHSGDLEIIVEPMKALLEEFPNLEFASLPFPSTDAITNPRYKRIDRWVTTSSFPQALVDWEGDIGIAPLRDNELNRAKSNLRWLEYSAIKIPSICSSVYPFKNSITNGKNGIIVGNSQKEWYEAMKSLILDQEKRRQIGETAYQTVRNDYDMEKVAKYYLSVLKEIKGEFLRKGGFHESLSIAG